MLLVIGDRKYDMHETLSKPSLNDLYYLKVKTRSEEFPAGVSLASLGREMERMSAVVDEHGPNGLLDDAEMLLALRALVFLCRKHAGENVTLDSANDFPLSEFSFEAEESDAVVVGEDPQ